MATARPDGKVAVPQRTSRLSGSQFGFGLRCLRGPRPTKADSLLFATSSEDLDPLRCAVCLAANASHVTRCMAIWNSFSCLPPPRIGEVEARDTPHICRGMDKMSQIRNHPPESHGMRVCRERNAALCRNRRDSVLLMRKRSAWVCAAGRTLWMAFPS